jgi:hypothetical protein
MRLARVRSFAKVTAACAAVVVFIAACGDDSTGPSNVDSRAALQSLQLGFSSIPDLESPEAATLKASLDAVAPILDQITVTIDGRSQTMFALGVRQTFPAGTCLEIIFPDPFGGPPPEPVCTPLAPEIRLILWQSHSASEPPDRMIVIGTDAGTSDFTAPEFDFVTIPSDAAPATAFAVYLEGEDNLWFSISGTLTSLVAATNQPCGLPQPPYAKAGSCSIATFDEEGAITFELLSDFGTSDRHLNLTIPRQTIRGFWENVTEAQPVTLSVAQQRASRLFGR